MRRLTVFGALMAVAVLALAAAPRARVQEPGPVTIQTMDVRENLFVISGGGGHTRRW